MRYIDKAEHLVLENIEITLSTL